MYINLPEKHNIYKIYEASIFSLILTIANNQSTMNGKRDFLKTDIVIKKKKIDLYNQI